MKQPKILLVGINAKYIHSNPAIHSLYAYAKEYQPYIELAEYTINQQVSDILADLYQRKPDVIAFSCYIWNMAKVDALLEDIPQVLPNTALWLGGPEVSFDAAERLKKNPSLTGVMLGEGEVTFLELVKHYVKEESAEKLADIAGICYARYGSCPAETSEIIYTKERQLTDLDSIPFFYEEMGLEQFENRIIYYESSRGCPFRCSYCLSSIDKAVRLRSLEKVLPELQFFLDHKVPQVKLSYL